MGSRGGGGKRRNMKSGERGRTGKEKERRFI